MLYQSYEQVVLRDRPAYWWRIRNEPVSNVVPNQGYFGTENNLAGVPTVQDTGPGLPGATQSFSFLPRNNFFGLSGYSLTHTLPGTHAGGITFELWIRLWFPSGEDPGAVNYTLMSRGAIHLFHWTAGRQLTFSPGSGSIGLPDGLPARQWTHLVGICRSGSNEFWVNGRRIRDVIVGAGETDSGTDPTASLTTSVASRLNSSWVRLSWGNHAEPAIYPYALSPQQIQEHYVAGITPLPKVGRMPLSAMSTFFGGGAPPPPPPPPALTAIGDLANRRVALVSDRPR